MALRKAHELGEVESIVVLDIHQQFGTGLRSQREHFLVGRNATGDIEIDPSEKNLIARERIRFETGFLPGFELEIIRSGSGTK